jgi:hypothetical protein
MNKCCSDTIDRIIADVEREAALATSAGISSPEKRAWLMSVCALIRALKHQDEKTTPDPKVDEYGNVIKLPSLEWPRHLTLVGREP